jgi:hypothetical protein
MLLKRMSLYRMLQAIIQTTLEMTPTTVRSTSVKKRTRMKMMMRMMKTLI